MWFWKRVEIYCGKSLKEFSELRDALASKGIEYDYKEIDNDSAKRNRHGNFAAVPNRETQYYLYVHHKDYDQAMYLTSNRKRK